MACSTCGGGSTASVVADPDGVPSDTQKYTIVYSNGEDETVTGLVTAQRRMIDPGSRGPIGARDGSVLATYSRRVD